VNPRKSRSIYALNSGGHNSSDAPEPPELNLEMDYSMEFDLPSRTSMPSTASSQDYDPSSSSDSDNGSLRFGLKNNTMDGKTSGSAHELNAAAVFDALSDEIEAILNNDNESLDSDDEVEDIIEEIDLGESLDALYWLGVFNNMYILLDKILSEVDLNNVKGFILYMEENLFGKAYD
jgi:hypothetical protein